MREYDVLYVKQWDEYYVIFKDDGDANWSVYLTDMDRDKAVTIVEALKKAGE